MSLISDFASTSGNLDGPVSSDNYKRAVYRQPPSRFSVEVLSPAKQGGSFSFGMRIYPIARESRASISTRSSNIEYEIWRRWEDCLWFQEVLESEYRRMSRQKRQRLLAGKGVKKNGIYLQDQAASFESLPPGPDPHSIARDIHEFLPRLTKKGTVFRASQATVNQRHREIQALVEALFKKDVPALLKELREERTVRDFFGFWRRDDDLARKQQSPSAKSVKSASSSVFSMYFSASNPNLQNPNIFPDLPPSPHLLLPKSPSTRSASSPRPSTADGDFRLSNHSSSDETINRRYDVRSTVSSGSSSSSHGSHASSRSSQNSLRDSTGSTTSEVPIIAEDVPIVFGHNPEHMSDYQYNDRSNSLLEALPEDRELSSKPGLEGNLSVPLRRRRKSSAAELQSHRKGQFFNSPPDLTASSHEPESPSSLDRWSTHPSNSSVRESWQTTASMGESILEGLNVMLPATGMFHRSRESTSSIATFMTNCSADAIIPGPIPSSSRVNRGRSLSGSHRFRSMSFSENDSQPDLDEEVLDSYFYEPTANQDASTSSLRTSGTSVGQPSDSNDHSILTPPPSPPPTSSGGLLSPNSFLSKSFTGGELISIKAAYENSIVVLRVARDISLEEMRQRLYKKFVGQEGVLLSESFAVAFLLPLPPHASGSGKSPVKSNPISSVSVSGRNHMKFVTSQDDWERFLSSADGGKLSLRILDNPS